ncbi:hypothetical protein DL240_03455 [Lujinxingia litoralis]|uniref:ABC transmembrane type-1 domain-containing protein n=1 Tax=Lujinxingia litoralis TaxID=2211119 RepID=A0A328CD66_9DELT|nr:ABC transporter permease [Lujinxingia litoralis]RAL25281.1 hypothetical protein DL240_03455 [Lujinxingia litoralis]
MFTYILKRVLMMIPTFAIISLIIFLVLNLAPGDPAAASNPDGTETVSQDARESYRIFKEQFNLDKPILLNTRFNLHIDDVEPQLRTVADFQRPVCAEGQPADLSCTPADERPSSGDIIAAQEYVENLGGYAVPHLLALAQNHERLDIRRLALQRLAINAQRPQVDRFNPNPTTELREVNRAIAAENNELRSWTVPQDVTEADIEEMLSEKWVPWYNEHQDRFEYSGTEKIGIFFLDTRFAKYWENLLKLDFGVSTVDRRPVFDTVMQKLPYTMTLSFLSILIAYIISVPLGIWSAYNQNTKRDQVVTIALFVFYSLPSFFTAVLLIEFFAVGRPFSWFPAGGFIGDGSGEMEVLEQIGSIGWHIFLPLICLTYGSLAALSRYARTGLLDVIRADYIRTARAKGLAESMVVLKHAVRNGMIPILTLLGTLLPALVSGSIVIEFIFNIPGIGLYLYESIYMYDYNAIMACLLMSTVLTLVGLLFSDISYALVDPRITFD